MNNYAYNKYKIDMVVWLLCLIDLEHSTSALSRLDLGHSCLASTSLILPRPQNRENCLTHITGWNEDEFETNCIVAMSDRAILAYKSTDRGDVK